MTTEIAPQMSPEQEKNWQIALQINREARANPDSPYANQCITVLNGEVVAQGKDLDEMTANLHALGVDTAQSVYIYTALDYDRIYNIGGFR